MCCQIDENAFHLVVFCLFACVFASFSALSSQGQALHTETKDVNLWANHFVLTELTDIVGHKCTQFAQLVNRVRKRKKDALLQEQDINVLKQCETSEGEDSPAIHTYATSREVDSHNLKMLCKMCTDVVKFEAPDFERIAKTVRLENKI